MGAFRSFRAWCAAGFVACAGVSGAAGELSVGDNPTPHPPRKADQDRAPDDFGSVVVSCAIPGVARIKDLAPAGRFVKKGEVVCELDAADLQARLAGQRLRVAEASRTFQGARLAREAAELERHEHEALDRHERDQARAEDGLAAVRCELARSRLKEARDRATAGNGGSIAVRRAELELDRSTKARELAGRRLAALARTADPKRSRELAAGLERARQAESACEAAVAREVLESEALAGLVALCRIIAPVSGRLIYANWRDPAAPGAAFARLEEGAEVHMGQVLFRIVPGDRGDPRPEAARAAVGRAVHCFKMGGMGAGCHGFVREPVRSAVAQAHGFADEPVAPISQIACHPF